MTSFIQNGNAFHYVIEFTDLDFDLKILLGQVGNFHALNYDYVGIFITITAPAVKMINYLSCNQSILNRFENQSCFRSHDICKVT